MPLPVNRQERNTSLEFLQAIHAMYVAILAARKIRDEQAPMLFPSARHVRQTGYPYQQLIGPVPRTENHLEERLLDQAQARAAYTPLFWGHSRSIPQGMILDVQPLVKSLFCPIRPSPNGFFDSEASTP